ncbi:hypothetical protein I317_05232 [Kwoniella heveanensis CBS 569]|nr:hypothetical protein I317_05232 [Kwoniella heveanensis CBS 569]
MVEVDVNELSRLWALIGDLSEQLANNRALIIQLKSRSENVKGQAAHVGTGFPLRRFNLDISNEQFQSELEAFSSHLVSENQQLQHENKQLNALLKEYEQTLETVMGKFRGIAHASQQHDLSLHSYYTSLLQTLQTAHSSAQLHDSTSLSTLLTRLSTLLRSALRSMGGEETDHEIRDQLPGLINSLHDFTNASGSGSGPNQGTIPTRGAPQQQPRPTSPPSPTQSARSAKSTASNNGVGKPFPKAPNRPVHFPGFVPGSSGGYAGTEGQADWALEREMEIMRLEEENNALREMLSIAQENQAGLPGGAGLGDEDGDGDGKDKGVDSPSGERSRKSSLTIAELEADAAKDDRIREMDQGLQRAGFGPGATDRNDDHTRVGLRPGSPDADKQQEEWEEDSAAVPPDGLDGAKRDRESVLGFDTDGMPPPPEEAIVDEPDAEAMDPNGE